MPPNDILNLKESGCAALTSRNQDRAGFMRFLFKYFPEYQETHLPDRGELGEKWKTHS